MLLERRASLVTIQSAVVISIEALQQLGAMSLPLSAMSRSLSLELGTGQLAVAVRVEAAQLLGTASIPGLLAELPLFEPQGAALLTADLTIAVAVEPLSELFARRSKTALAAHASPASAPRSQSLSARQSSPTSAQRTTIGLQTPLESLRTTPKASAPGLGLGQLDQEEGKEQGNDRGELHGRRPLDFKDELTAGLP